MKKLSDITYLWFLIMYLFSIPYISGQEALLKEIISLQRNGQYEQIEKKASLVLNVDVAKLIIADVIYQRTGEVKLGVKQGRLFNNLKEEIISEFLYADVLKRSGKIVDSVVFEHYRNAFVKANAINDSLLTNETLARLNRHLLRNGSDIKTYRKYVDLAKSFANDSISKYWWYYNEAGYEMRHIEKYGNDINTTKFDTIFSNGLKNAVTPYHKGYMQQFQGIYLESYVNNNSEALKYYRLARENYEKKGFYYSLKGLASLDFNQAIIHYENKRFNDAILGFQKTLKIEKDPIYIMYGYDWIYKSYEGLKQFDSAYYYFKKMVSLKELIDQKGHAIEIKEIESEATIKIKTEELESLIFKNKSLINRFDFLIPIVLLSIVLGGFYYFKLRKTRNDKKSLLEEKSETLRELKNLKEIVTKDFIVLKDGRKIYVKDLLYIKSDDHFLRVFTQDGKSHFVRGKLTKMNEGLPPNFIRCHRSYIVNENYIGHILSSVLILLNKTEIPVSKSYQSYFKAKG